MFMYVYEVAIAMASIVPVDPSLVRAAGMVAVVASRVGDFDEDDDDDDEDYDLASYRIRNRIRLMHHRFHSSILGNINISSAPTIGQISLRTSSVGSSGESRSSYIDSSAPARGFLQRQHGFMQVRNHSNDLDGGISDGDDGGHSSISEILSERRHHRHLDNEDSNSDDDIENVRLPQRSGTAS